MQAGSLEISLYADVARIKQDMDRARSIVASGAKAMEDAAARVRSALGGIAGGLSVAAFGAWVKGAIDAADALNDLSKSTDIAVGKLAGLRLAAGQSGSDLNSTAQAINKLQLNIGKDTEKFRAIGITAKDGLGAFKQLADLYVAIEDPQMRAAVAAEALGKSWAGAAPLLSEGSKRIQEMVDKGELLSGMNQDVADSSDEFNDRMEELKTALGGAATSLAADLLPLMTELAKDLTLVTVNANGADSAFNPFTETLRALIIVGGNVAFVLKTIGNDLGGMAAQVAAVARGDFAGAVEMGRLMRSDAERNRAAFDAWEQKMLSVGRTAKAVAKDAKEAASSLTAAQIAALKAFADQESAKKVAEAARKAREEAKKLAEEFEKLRDGLLSSEAGVDAGFLSTLKRIAEGGRTAGLSIAQVTHLQELYIRKQPFILAQEKEALAVAQERQKLRQSESDQIEAYMRAESERLQEAARGAEAAAQAAEDEFAQRDMLKSQIATITLLRLQEGLATKTAGTEAHDSLERQIAAQEKLIEVFRRGEAREAQDKEARKLLEVWESIDRTAHDVWTNIWEGGSNVFKKLGQTLKAAVLDLLYQMTVRKWIISIGTSMGVPGAAMAGQIGGNLIGSALGSFGSGFGAELMSGTLLSNIGAGMAGVGGSFASTVGAGLATDAIGATVAEGAAAATLGSGSTIGAALAAIPGWGWALMAAAAVAALLSKGGGPKADGSFGFTVSDIGAGGTTSQLNQSAMATATALQKQFDALAKLGGLTGSGVQFGAGISTDPEGDSPSFLDITASRNGSAIWHQLNRNIGRSEQELAAAMTQMGSQALLGALQSVMWELPPVVRRELEGIDTTALSTEAAQAIAATIEKALNEKQTLEARLFALTHTEAEILAAARQKERDALDESNRALYDRIIALEDEKAATERVAASLKALADERSSLEVELLRAQGNDAGANALQRTLDITGMSEAEIAAYDYNAALREQIKLANEAAAAVTAAAQTLKALQGETSNLQVQLLQAQGNDAGAQALQRQIDTAGMDAAAVAVYDYNQSLRAQIIAVNQAKAAQEAAATQKKSLEQQLLTIQGDTAALRQLELDALDPANHELQKHIWALEDEAAAAAKATANFQKLSSVAASFLTPQQFQRFQAQALADQFNAATGYNVTAEQVLGVSLEDFAAFFTEVNAAGNTGVAEALLDIAGGIVTLRQSIDGPAIQLAQQRATMEAQLARLNGDLGPARALELAAMDESLRPLQELIWAREGELAILNEREGLQMQLWRLLGDEVAIRAALLEKLDPSNRALQEEIWRIEDRTKAMEEQKRAAEALRQQWANLTDSMIEEARRLRGAAAGTSPGASLAYLQAQFAMANAAARAGDTVAAGRLPGLSQAVEQAAMLSARSLPELNTIRSQLATSLESTASARGHTDGSAAVVNEVRELRREAREDRVERKKHERRVEELEGKVANVLERSFNAATGSIYTTAA